MAINFTFKLSAIFILLLSSTIQSVSEATDITCHAITVPNATVTYLQPSSTTQFQSGTIALLNCPLGKIPSGNPSSMCRNGVWSPQMGMCKSLFPDPDVKCSPIAPIANGQVFYLQVHPVVQNAAGTLAMLICNIGYTVFGTTTAKCTNAGTWESLGTCESWDKLLRITCPEITVINGNLYHDILRPRKVGTASSLICNFGSVLVGNAFVTCMPNGQWSSDIGKCQYLFPMSHRSSSVQCSVLSVADGIVAYDLLRSRSEGTIAVLICNIGFLPSGNTIASCQSSGQWSSTLGKCTSMATNTNVCPTLTTTNGFIGYDIFRPRQVGTVATLICNVGFVISGAISVTCKDDKTWNGVLGTCKTTVL